jgi:uncharacterized LabA/DUF88 family protein
MVRFALFVDGSNLFGSLKSMGIEIEDYEAFYRHIFELALARWREAVDGGDAIAGQLRRVYWYEVGSMDVWDLTDPKAQATLREWFEKNKELKDKYMAVAGKKLASSGQEKVAQDKVAKEAWGMCFEEARVWYEKKKSALDGIRRFHHAVRTSTDWIDVIEAGHWKLDLLNAYAEEKGLDTSLAVDMVTQAENFDVALLVSGDADGIPSIRYLKTRNKEVAAVEFVHGYPPDKKGKGFSSKLKLAADFVVRVYEMELVTKGIAKKAGEPKAC